MDRRTFIGAVTGGFLAAPVSVCAQKAPQMYRIGFLGTSTDLTNKLFWDAMRGLGWVEGQNVKIEWRIASHRDQLPALAADLVQLKVDLIVTGGTPATTAAKPATATIPIVFTVSDDPVQNGLVSSLARPGGNLTGVLNGRFDEKMLQLLKETVPGIARVAYPFFGATQIVALERAAKVLGIQLQRIALRGPDEFDPFFAEAKKGRADAALIPDLRGLYRHLERIAAETLKERLPAISHNRLFAEAGGLLSYGVPDWVGPVLAAQIDKILKGAKPADVPVQQPTKFELVINMRTAKALGLTIPKSFLARADEVIQ